MTGPPLCFGQNRTQGPDELAGAGQIVVVQLQCERVVGVCEEACEEVRLEEGGGGGPEADQEPRNKHPRAMQGVSQGPKACAFYLASRSSNVVLSSLDRPVGLMRHYRDGFFSLGSGALPLVERERDKREEKRAGRSTEPRNYPASLDTKKNEQKKRQLQVL